ncbi:MAG: hypothetical protein IJY18_02450 [Clostridia bacterium]|nr:hypothetical protein [Clostridia bacterium]
MSKDKEINKTAAGETDVKERFYTNPWVILAASVLVIAIIVGAFVGVNMNSLGITLSDLFVDEYARGDLFAKLFNTVPEPIDFVRGDLSSFIDLSGAKYKDFEVEIDIPEVSETEFEEDLIYLLASKRGDRDNEYKFEVSEAIAPGDVVYLRYIAYQIDENGERREIPGFSNFDLKDSDLKAVGGLKVGGRAELSGYRIIGLDSALVGKVPLDYQCNFNISRGGAFFDGEAPEDLVGDVAYITASYIREKDGRLYEDATIRMELDDPELEDKWGDGVLSYLAEKSIGLTNSSPITMNCETTDKDGNPISERITFLKSTVNYVTRGIETENVLTVDITFPYDLENEELRGKSAKLDVFFFGVTTYETAELNDSFITEKLGMKEEKLASYEGETLVEKFKNYRRSLLISDRNEAVERASEDAVWEYLKANIDIKKIPQRELTRIYDNYYYMVYAGFLAAGQEGISYDGIDDYAIEYFQLSRDDNWYDHIYNMALDEVKEKLIFYSIIRTEGLMPNEEEYKALYRKELEADYTYASGLTREDYKTDAEYEEALATFESDIIKDKGEAFYEDAVYYYYATDTIISYAKVNNIAIKK